MTTLALKRKYQRNESTLQLVEEMDIQNKDDRKWFRNFLESIFSSPDFDYSQFERIEGRRSRQQMERDGLY